MRSRDYNIEVDECVELPDFGDVRLEGTITAYRCNDDMLEISGIDVKVMFDTGDHEVNELLGELNDRLKEKHHDVILSFFFEHIDRLCSSIPTKEERRMMAAEERAEAARDEMWDREAMGL